MMRRLILLALCGLAPAFATHARSPSEPPLSAELHVGTRDNTVARLIWVPTRWTPAVSEVRLKRRLVGTAQWADVQRLFTLRDREKLNLIHAQPADFARLRQQLLSDHLGAVVRGFAIGDNVSKLPKGEYEYGVFARIGDGDFLENPVATAIWKQPLPRTFEADLKPLGVYRDANGMQAQVAVDARQMMSWAVGVRVTERHGAFLQPELHPLQIPATRDGWTAICHRLKEPLPDELIFSIEDGFGNSVKQSVDIDRFATFGKPAVPQAACMRAAPPVKASYNMPRPKLSPDLELFVGGGYFETRVLWIPKRWPEGMEGVQIMRRRGAEPWTPVDDIKRPSGEILRRLKTAETAQQFERLAQDMRSDARYPLYEYFRVDDEATEKMPDGVVEYGAFPVISGSRSAEPAATASWVIGTKTDADFGIDAPRMVRDGKNLLALFSVDGAKLDEKAGALRALQVSRSGGETPYALILDGGGPRRWKYLCVPIVPGETKAVKIIAGNRFGISSALMIPIQDAPSAEADPAAISQCFTPEPSNVAPSPVAQDVMSRPPPPSPPQSQPQPQPMSNESTPGHLEPSSTPIDVDALLDGARMWLDAAQNVSHEYRRVTAWRDTTLNGFVATMNDPNRRPTAVKLSNGLPAIRFTGGQSLHLERPIEMRAGTLFIVGRSGGQMVRNIILGPVGNNKNNQLRWEGAQTAMIVGPHSGSNIVQFPVGDTTTLHVLGVRYDGMGVGFWRNGRPSNAHVFNKSTDEPYSFNSIGSYYSQMYLHGEIAAIVWLPQALTPAEIEAVDVVLRDRYRVR